MKRLVVVVIAVLLASGFVSSGVFASGPGMVSEDTYVSAGDPTGNFGDQFLTIGTGGACSAPANQSETTFLRWNFPAAYIGNPVGSAEMTLSVFVNTASGATQLTLYRVADDAWTQAGLTYNYPTPGAGGPALGAAIQTIDLAAGYTGLVTFGAASPASSELANYIREQLVAGDGKASFALRVTSCPEDGGAGVTILLFSSETGGPGAMAQSANAPDAPTWPFLTIAPPTAVTMSTFHAADPAVNWPLIAGVGALAAVLIGGLAVARRRAATH
jgi:hypothetical protein